MIERKTVGIIGISGRVGGLLAEEIGNSDNYSLGISFSRDPSNSRETRSLKEVFIGNDYVVDFSSASIIKDILVEANFNPKPLLLCSTGWKIEDFQKDFIDSLSHKSTVIIAPNTSVCAALQLHCAHELYKKLGSEYMISITETHHKHKKDSPSGTAKELAKKLGIKESDIISHRVDENPGEHEVVFTSNYDSISLKHNVFDRTLFAKGVINILDWIKNNPTSTGVYSVLDILNL